MFYMPVIKIKMGPLLIFKEMSRLPGLQYKLPDVITEFEIGDGASELRDTTISVGYDKGIKSKQFLMMPQRKWIPHL